MCAISTIQKYFGFGSDDLELYLLCSKDSIDYDYRFWGHVIQIIWFLKFYNLYEKTRSKNLNKIKIINISNNMKAKVMINQIKCFISTEVEK